MLLITQNQKKIYKIRDVKQKVSLTAEHAKEASGKGCNLYLGKGCTRLRFLLRYYIH